MNRRRVIIISMLCVAFLAALVAGWIYPKFKKIDKQGPAPAGISAVIPNDLDSTAASIRMAFNNWSDFERLDRIGNYKNKFPSEARWSRFFLFRRDDTQSFVFPTDDQILLDRGADSFVEQYVRLPSDLRAGDFYLYEPSGDYYWESEYFYNGRPAKFRCSFLIHLEPAGNTNAKVEIFEYQPTIWVGQYLGLTAHAVLPAMLYDIRSVQATTTDRKDLLAIIQEAQKTK